MFIIKFLPGQKKSSGIADLFKVLIGFAVPGASFFLNKGRDALGGIRSLNQRLRNTDFGRSRTLADYFDAKSYGGIDARNAAAVANMAQARGIQKQMAQRPSSQVTARDQAMGGGGGGGATSTSGSKSTGGGFSSSDRGAALHG